MPRARVRGLAPPDHYLKEPSYVRRRMRSTSPPVPALAGRMLQFDTNSVSAPRAAKPPGKLSPLTIVVGDVLCGGTRTTAPVPGAALSSPCVENSVA